MCVWGGGNAVQTILIYKLSGSSSLAIEAKLLLFAAHEGPESCPGATAWAFWSSPWQLFWELEHRQGSKHTP